MGSGASVDLVAEQAKPLDLSDVLTPRGESVKAELIRIRTLLRNTQFEPADAEPAAEVGGSVESESESEAEMSPEDAAALRKKRRNKTGPGTTRSGRKGSVMSEGMKLSMAHATGESVKGYQMEGEMEATAEGTESQENSPKPPPRDIEGGEGAEAAPAAEAGAVEGAAEAAAEAVPAA
ncbi:hypothetical protein TrCOL_g12774 [Triparma columacea]|uniref:Uncharacterized protein n=1 Tax=Triparma columacea TaxID=722753 RepID=A0A9W7GB07_9STRA|nr:hypothetical protein TrCOL_g12774 [Triparma columacea]